MRKKLLAASITAMFILSALTIAPVAGHFTLGDYTTGSSSGRLIHANDFDPHVPGPLAYVWPGSGFAAYTGTPNGFPPGYQPPYPDGKPSGQPANIYQLESNSYSPFGAILTSTNDHSNTGSLIFALNFSRPCEIAGVLCDSSGNALPGSKSFDYERITIYIPPEFGVNYDSGYTETTFSSDLGVSKSGPQDPIGPGWSIYKASGNIQFWPQHNYEEWYYIRINNVAAPKIAGKYFFKIFLWDQQMDVPGGWNTDSRIAGGEVKVPESGATPLTVPVENWPVLLVKGEVDPGVITGTIRYGTFNATLYGRPITLPGLVRAVGTEIDPYTGVTTARIVEARGYFNASAAGHFEVEGIAPGVYTIYASAAGYPEQIISTGATVLAGQSLHLDGYVQPGAVINGRIFSKHMFGDEAWPSNPRPVLVEIYSSNDYSLSDLVAWSPWNKTHAPYMAYDWPQGSSIPEPLPVAYPWDAVTPNAFAYYSDSFNSPPLSGQWISHDPVSCGDSPTPERNADPCGKPDGVGPAQYWWVDGLGAFTNGGGSTAFNFRFGVKGVYGAPTEYDGHVPQPYATWVNGLTAGRYWARAWINGYTQTTLDGATLDEYPFDVTQSEWAGDISLPMDLHVSSAIVDTVHFHDQPNTTQECPINGCTGNVAQGLAKGDRFLIAELRDSGGTLMGLNFTLVSSKSSEATIQVNGFGMFGPDPRKDDMKFSYLRYQGIRDYGLPAGTYTIYLYMRGYLPDNAGQQVSVTLSGNAVVISSHLYRGARFDVTANSIDWQTPIIERPWEFPGASLNIYVYLDGKSITSQGLTQPAGVGGGLIGGGCHLSSDEQATSCHVIQWDGSTTTEDDGSDEYAVSGFDPLEDDAGGFLRYPSNYRLYALNSSNAFETGTYSFDGFAYGYVQYLQPSVYAQRGSIADIQFDLLKGVNMTLDIIFKKEGIITPTAFNMSMRIRVYNDFGNLIATARSKTPGSTVFNSGEPLGIARAGHDGGTYYVDPFASSPSIANGLVTVDPATTGDTFLWHGTWNGIKGWQAFDSDPDHDGIPDFSVFNPNYEGYTTWIPAGTDQIQVSIAGPYDTYGIDGRSPSINTGYLGGWTIEVDTWNEYPAPKFDSTTGIPLKTNWYPPSPSNLEGLLEGDNFHTIPGDPARPFGYRGNRYRTNGLGPYAQRYVWKIPNAQIGSETSAAFELDKRGFLSGTVYGFNWSNELRTQSWTTLQAASTNGTFTSYSWDGYFDMYLDSGNYGLQVIAWKAEQGYTTINSTIYVGDGQSSQLAFYLERSNIPIPEFSGAAITLLSAMSVTIYLVRRKSRAAKPFSRE